ncbi:retroelement silencing factor 1 [Arvicola amphibius]|uniref:retroelement silencing factor 1 n=1 Tax=Arvicola amphibius TaxID=1047088 RepID=UPI0018E300CA|nr:retroelement silencing factor 1 [Arvicola amphibius]XP_038176224.1 retroelement silencing factor 1 [Arvicola amphibius]XP_038176225.1 retroelement silencing factor 1 [Arvicola amphibius]XP_038176226.1 retroelement silencing factor 1 [Arvicola amphibius]XP_038176227.1 retroelement silencing factor 1 [Arvicola amphibius]XP_038176228.1 retroelement silencing factor 1 [Arvicola amphibius]XP_038176229.1 retroelement silencing factor 1 [Arvicola amphibius]XP_038176230.1 retroelement silencing f
MNWNAKPENAAQNSPYSKSQSSLLQQFLLPSTTSQSSFSCLPQNQEPCMYPTNSNSVSQPLLNVRSYITPQLSISNMHNRTIVASQTSVERVTSTNVKGAQQPNHSLQTVSSGVVQNVWMNSTMRNFIPSHTEAAISHKPDGGSNMPYMHAPQSQIVTSDNYSVQLQMTPSNSVRVPINCQGNYQGNQGLNHSIPDQLVGWTQCTPSEPTYPDYRPPPKQYPCLPQNFVQDPSVQKQNFVSSMSLQARNNQLASSTQTLQSKHPVPVSIQYAAETSKRLLPPPYSCRYGGQNMQNSQPVSRHLSVEIPQSSEMHSSEKKKDTYKGFQQQWQNINENPSTIGKFCELKINTRQSYNDSASSSGDGVQTLVQNNQEERKYPCNPSTNQVLDTNATKEKLVRDIKSLVEIKKKFSELARKIKINKDLLMAAGCSKTANTNYTEPTQHSEFSTKEMSAKRSSPYSMELLATCLSLWKNQPPKTTEESVPKPLEEKQRIVSRTSTTAVGSSNPTNEVHVKNFCSDVRSSQKMSSSSQTVLSVLTQSYESPDVTVGKGTELQIAVVSPLILSNIKTAPGKELAPEVAETVYPVVKEGSVCSLQDQQAENTTVAVALPFDATGGVTNTISAELSLPMLKEKQHNPTQADLDIADSSLGKHSTLCTEALPNPKDSTVVSGPMLQIESICSLAEGDVSYNSQIAEIFNSVKNEPQKPSSNQQIINSQQEEQVDDTTENKNFDFKKDKCVQCTDVPHEVSAQPVLLQPLEPASSEDFEANKEILEESNKNTGVKGTIKDVCSPAAIQQDPHQETDTVSIKSSHNLTAINEVNDENEPVSYLHDQLSELLKEFPYGIETVSRHEVSVGQRKIHEVSENQTDHKTGNMSVDSTDQIKITVLNSDQIKELFPEEDQPCDLDTLAVPENRKVIAEENRKVIAEVKSPCDSQVPREESHDPEMLDVEKDKIHCCALGWLSMVYEGVPQCHCRSINEKEKDQCSLEDDSCKQGEQSCNSGITIFEINPISNNPKSPLIQAADKGNFSEIHGEKIKTPQTKDGSLPKVEKELTDHVSVKCYKKDKDKCKTKQDSSLKMEQKLKNVSSKCDRLNPLKRNKITTEIYQVTTSNSDKNTPTFSKQAFQESIQKKHLSQDSGPVKAHVELLPNKDPCRRNNFLVQSVSPEKKKLKFKAGSSRLKYFEKRKIDHVLIPDMEIKKKKYEKQEENKNGGARTLTEPNERASVKEKTVPDSESSHSKASSSKSTRVITVQEYLQRQKDKHSGSNASKNRENMPCDSEHMKSSKQSASPSWGKLIEGQDVSAETSKEPEHNPTSHGKNLKFHHSEESRMYNVSRNSSGKLDRKQLDKAYIDKTKLERLTSMSNKSSEIPLQVKEQRKQYLNRVAFKCTERESICLTKLDSASKKLNKEKSRVSTSTANDDTDKPSMLEFKLCPDVLLKNTGSADMQDDPRPGPGKEQAPVQVSGIKSTKEDWLKCIPARTKIPESSQEIDRADSRLPKRSFSADEFETLQNPVKDSDVMFRTYKKMYLEKRSRSLGSSPVK